MSRAGRPFIFCHYQITVDDELLDAKGQHVLLQELQGKLASHRARGGEQVLDSLIMRPVRKTVAKHTCLFFSVGHLIDQRVRAVYDARQDRITLSMVEDGGVKFTDFVAIPEIGLLAVDDRGGELHLGGKGAISRFKSVVFGLQGAVADVSFFATAEDVDRALKQWSLTSFKFTIRPNNPRPVSRLARELGDKMKADGIGVYQGVAKPPPGEHIKVSNDGLIKSIADLESAGYGQIAFAGQTEQGLAAEIKKPRFDTDVDRNEQIQARPRELRIYVDDQDLDDSQVFDLVAKSMIAFHDEQ